ncbi:ABC transporter substrate-binding protein [Cryobacterium sp. Y11]|uniref:ABC transporter substrate-binding protein n=1 Tax=Cryobacterium sp. Y11 TaxID=2045016 RepID=UPI000CE52B90|nr:ABC transporter substrate-binding protein [Cryobacterium sp. Y11]
MVDARVKHFSFPSTVPPNKEKETANMNKNTKLTMTAAGAIVVIGTLALGGCSSSTGAGQNVDGGGEVSLSYTMPDVFTTTMEDVTARMDGDVTLSAESIGNTYNDLTQRIATDAAAGTVPDLALVSLNQISNFVEQGIAQPIDALIESEGVDLSTIDPTALSLSKVDGKLYGMPLALSAPMLYFNADLFIDSGLDPATPPATWDEVRESAEALVAHGHGGVVYAWDNDQWIFQSQVRSGGGSMLTDDGTQVAFNDENGVRALTEWVDLADNGLFPVLASTPTPDALTAFTEGKIGMWVGSSNVAASVTSQVSFDVRTTTFPSADGSPTPLAAGGAAIMMLTKDESSQKRAAAVFAEFGSPETSTSLTTSTGYLPINKTARESSSYLKDFLASQPLREPAIEELPRLEPWTTYSGNRSVEITERIAKEIEAALKGIKTPQQALDDAAEAANALIGVK